MCRLPWVLLLVLAGCDAPPVAKDPPPASAPISVGEPPQAPMPIASTAPVVASVSAAPVEPPKPRFDQITLSTADGELTPLLREAIGRAKPRELSTLVYFYADWCPPCRAFQKHLASREIQEALEGVYLVKLNMDDWHDKLRGTGFAPKKIPSFYFVSDDGRPTGKTFDGDNWGKDPSAAKMADAIKAFRRPPAPRKP